MLVIQFVHVSLVIMNAHVKVIESAIVTQVIALVIQVIALVILIDIAHATVETVIVTPIKYAVVIQETACATLIEPVIAIVVIVIATPIVHVIPCVLQRTLVMGAHVKEIVQLMQQLVVVVNDIKILEVQ